MRLSLPPLSLLHRAFLWRRGRAMSSALFDTLTPPCSARASPLLCDRRHSASSAAGDDDAKRQVRDAFLKTIASSSVLYPDHPVAPASASSPAPTLESLAGTDAAASTGSGSPATHPVFLSVASFLDQFQSTPKDQLPPAQPFSSSVVYAVSGRVHARRVSAKTSFLDIIQDNRKLQIVVMSNRHSPDEFKLFHEGLRRGDIVHVVGTPFVTKLGELSLASIRIRLLAPCLAPLPLSASLTDPDTRARNRAQDFLVNPSILPLNLWLKGGVLKTIRSFMDERQFLEVETPTLCALAGGASARPFKTHANALDSDLHLRIAPELFLKQLVIGGIERVFEIGKQFRNESIDHDHHPEFTTMEMYQAYARFEDLFEFTESLLARVVGESNRAKRSFLGTRYLPDHKPAAPSSTGGSEDNLEVEFAGRKVSFRQPFKRISIPDELERDLGEPLPDLSAADAVERLVDLFQRKNLPLPKALSIPQLVDELVSTFIEPKCEQPTFLCNHPVAMSPLAKAYPDKPSISQRFELFVAGFEICNAYAELNDPKEQRKRFGEQMKARASGDEEAQQMDEEFCKALEFGLPPTVGWGLGVDRLVMLLTGATTIRDVLPFPLMRPQTNNTPLAKKPAE